MSLKPELLAIDPALATGVAQQTFDRMVSMLGTNPKNALDDIGAYQKRYPGMSALVDASTAICYEVMGPRGGRIAATGAALFAASLIELAELAEMPDIDADPDTTSFGDVLSRLSRDEVKARYDAYHTKNQQLHDTGREDERQAPLDPLHEQWPGLVELPALIHAHAKDVLGLSEELAEQRAVGATQVVSFLFDIARTESMPPIE